MPNMRLNNKAADYMKAKNLQQSDLDAKLWAQMKEWEQTGLLARQPFDQRWTLSLSFLAGRQYAFFNTAAHALQMIKPLRGRIRAQDNKLLSYWRRNVADLIKNRPQMSAVPGSPQPEDIDAAKTADKGLKAWWEINKVQKKLRQLAGWIYSTGNGFMEDFWNPQKGPIDTSTGKARYLGDADVCIYGPYDLLVPFFHFGLEDLDEFPWMMLVRWKPLEWFEQEFGKKGLAVEEEDQPKTFVDTGMIMGGIPTPMSVASKTPSAMYVELRAKPCQLFPNGARLKAANGVVLEKEAFPYSSYGISHFKELDFPGIFWGKSTMEDGIGLQKTWNRTLSDLLEFNRTMGKGKWLIPKGSKAAFDPDDTHGEVLRFKPVMGHAPSQLTLKGVPTSYDKTFELTEFALNKLFSQHEVTQGTNRSDIRSGEMVAILREQDAHGNIPTNAVFEESLEEVMTRVLRRIKEGYTTQRIMQVTGKDNQYEVLAFKGADLQTVQDVKVKRQAGLPDSRVAREAIIMERFQQGLYGDPRDPEVRRTVINLLEDAVVEEMYSEERLDERVARWENEVMIERGEPLKANDYDNHVVHLREHDKYLKAIQLQKLKVENPQVYAMVYALVTQHRQLHQEFVMEMQQQQLEMQAAVKGGKGGPAND